MEISVFLDPLEQLSRAQSRHREGKNGAIEREVVGCADFVACAQGNGSPRGGLYRSGKAVVAWWGRICNEEELRKRHCKGADSTGALLLRLMEKDPERAPTIVRGRICIFHYNLSSDKLTVSRSKLGLTPVFFVRTNQFFGVSTNPEVLLECREFRERPNRKRLAAFLVGAPVAGRDDYVRPLERLLPGELVVVDGKCHPRFYQYYSRLDAKPSRWEAYDTEGRQLYECLKEILQKYLREPAVFEMSGGMDSTALVALQCRLRKEGKIADEEPKTATILARDSPFEDEFNLVRAMLDRFSLDWKVYNLDGNVSLMSETLLERTGSFGPQWFQGTGYEIEFRKFVRNAFECRFVISGLGGDHLFSGAPWDTVKSYYTDGNFVSAFQSGLDEFGFGGFIAQCARRGLSATTPAWFRKAVKQVLPWTSVPPWLDFSNWLTVEIPSANSLRLGEPANEQGLPREMSWQWENFVREFRRKNLLTGIQYILPYFDSLLVEKYSHLPAHYKFRNSLDKAILRRAFQGILPRRILSASKRLWFGRIVESAIRRDEQEIIDLFSSSRLADLGLIDRSDFLDVLSVFTENVREQDKELGVMPIWWTISAEKWLQRRFS